MAREEESSTFVGDAPRASVGEVAGISATSRAVSISLGGELELRFRRRLEGGARRIAGGARWGRYEWCEE